MKATIASIALLLAMVANAGPFGYEMGQKIEGEPDGVASDIGSNYKELQNPPPPFDRVLAFYTEETGVCAVKGIIDIPNYELDESGIKHRRRADWLAGQVAAKYGDYHFMFDYLREDARWREPNLWLESVARGEREYNYFWMLPGEPDNIDSIGVNVNYGFVHLLYHFTNEKQCANQLQDSL